MPVIEVSHLTKEYRLGAMQSIKQTLLNTGARLMGKQVPERSLFKALDDVSFSIEQGEVVGIIGHNGAGKSTLLKMLARISTPTRGTVKVNGRIAPLIEVGAGFVPDFTGRENVYLNGAILGMSKQEIDRKFDEIVDFAEMAQFIDTPVKRYSSGMQVKLAFAVATSIESEILIVDEVLAVGDLAFQRKCFDRMEDMIKRQGRTVLIVSHNIRQIERLCTRVLLLDHGEVKIDGQPNSVCNAFYEQNDRIIASQKAAAGGSKLASTGEVELLDLYCAGPDGSPVKELVHGDNVKFCVRIKANKPLVAPLLHIGIHTTDFVYLSTATSPQELRETTLPVGIHELSLDVNHFLLLPGVYSIRFSVDVEAPIKNVLYGENLYYFTVISKEIQRTASSCEGFFPMNESRWQLRAT
jgi:ABC-type polysaccharide/polyol phosphate transport system ATPase subunit